MFVCVCVCVNACVVSRAGDWRIGFVQHQGFTGGSFDSLLFLEHASN